MSMSASPSTDEVLVEKLLIHLKAEGYSLRLQQWYPSRVRQLLDYCNGKDCDREGPLGARNAVLAPAISALAEAA